MTPTTMLMHNPPLPGEVIKRPCMEPLGLTVTKIAKGLGVVQHHVHADQRPARDLARDGDPAVQGFGGSSESWLRQQMEYDLWQTRQKAPIKVRKFEAA